MDRAKCRENWSVVLDEQYNAIMSNYSAIEALELLDNDDRSLFDPGISGKRCNSLSFRNAMRAKISAMIHEPDANEDHADAAAYDDFMKMKRRKGICVYAKGTDEIGVFQTFQAIVKENGANMTAILTDAMREYITKNQKLRGIA